MADVEEQEQIRPETKLQALNRALTRSWVGRYFEVEQRNSTFFQEVRAGVVCFLTVCYIIPVNSGILTDTGGTCDPALECSAGAYAGAGAACRFFDPGFAACQARFKTNIIAATCIASMIATFIMALVARMPLAVAPAMGVNAYFTYNVVGYLATGKVTYKQALAAVFVEGWIFIFISVTGARGHLVELIPKNIMYSTAAGIGTFLAFIGLQQAEGIGLVTYDGATLVSLGGCPPDQRYRMYAIYDGDFSYDSVCASNKNPDGTINWVGQTVAMGPRSANYGCGGKQMTSPTTWLGIATGIIMVVLMMKDIKASILIGILFCTFISWIPTHSATYFKDRSPTPGGQARFEYFLKGAVVPSVEMTGGMLEFKALNRSDVWVALITFLYLDFMDATSTMYAMARLVGEHVPGFVNEKGVWPRQMLTMVTDGLAIVIGSTLGTSPLTVFAESAIGIRAGGRTGISSFIIAIGFGISMFLSPIFASIPPYATGPALILVGALMMEHSRYVNWDDPRQAVPAFLTIVLMPLTYSIAYGIICGLSFVIFLWAADALWETVAVLSGYYKGQKTLYHVWLDTNSHFYAAFGKEQVLIDNLPGYKSTMPFEVEPHAKVELGDKA
ncbi:hypothetical protein QJQ45_020878 [Haematococcus lacustris]|nr:hypothetical protein QJQ45_020878 [Haematococcus lacustris]